MIEVPRAALTAGAHRRGGRVLLVRHQRPHPDDVRLLARRRRQVPARVRRRARSCRATRSCRSTPEGVGALMEWAVERGRERTRPKLKVGICGEHGGDPASVEFCHRAGLDYVSCSPFRVPIARLAAAQAAVRGSAAESDRRVASVARTAGAARDRRFPRSTRTSRCRQVLARHRRAPGARLARSREIVVADNGSSDGTAEVARAAGATVVLEPRRGYGAACLAGLAHLRRRSARRGRVPRCRRQRRSRASCRVLLAPLVAGARRSGDRLARAGRAPSRERSRPCSASATGSPRALMRPCCAAGASPTSGRSARSAGTRSSRSACATATTAGRSRCRRARFARAWPWSRCRCATAAAGPGRSKVAGTVRGRAGRGLEDPHHDRPGAARGLRRTRPRSKVRCRLARRRDAHARTTRVGRGQHARAGCVAAQRGGRRGGQ